MVQNPQIVFASIMAKKTALLKQDRTALETNQTAEIAWLTNQAQEHPVVGMTPQHLYRLLTDAEQGNLQAQADLFADMEERDGHIFSEMDKRKKGINGLDWGVKPPKMHLSKKRKLLKKFVNGLRTFKTLKCFCLMRWMLLGMVTAVKKLNGIKLATYGCRKL